LSSIPTILAQSIPSWWWLQHVPAMVFIFCFGACVGSFLNVVIYRLPAGMSVITPPSRCPTCGARLRFFRENLPILGWFMVRGKCRYCGVKVSSQYMLIELLMALTFLGLYVVLFALNPRTSYWSEIGGAWWHYNTIVRAWPAYIAWAFLLASLVAMTIIDARTFTIPLQIPLFITATAFVAYPLQAILPLRPVIVQTWPIPGVGWTGLLMSVGGMLGLLFAYTLLRIGKLRYSFADYNDYLPPPADSAAPASRSPDAGEVTAFELVFALPLVVAIITAGVLGPIGCVLAGIAAMVIIVLSCKARGINFGPDAVPSGEDVLAADYPHARREMMVELVYLAPCIVLMTIGFFIGRGMTGVPSDLLQAVGVTFAGYLMGGGLIWGIRILGSLAFNKEAMGLGDVHLLAAVGAVLGWSDPILVFFLAPFFGILWAGFAIGLGSIFRKARRELPYGPHLALATLAVILCRPWINSGFARFMPGVPFPPSPGFIAAPGALASPAPPARASRAVSAADPSPRPAGATPSP
jgi:prepilin signal peptidase PulO-like enzyme (type II secretory pathway)